MKIIDFFKRPSDVYIALSTENVERRDAKPFYSFDTDMPKVKPLWDKEEDFIIYERTIGEEVVLDYEETVCEYKPVVEQPVISFEFELLKTLLLPAGKPVKLLGTGRQPLLLTASEQTLIEVLEAQHVIYFSDVEFKDGAEMITEAKVVREKQRNLVGAKVMEIGRASCRERV